MIYPSVTELYVHWGPLGDPGWKVARMHYSPFRYERVRNATNRDMRELRSETGQPILAGIGYHGQNPEEEYR